MRRLEEFVNIIDKDARELNLFQLDSSNIFLHEVACLLPKLNLDHGQEEVILNMLEAYLKDNKQFLDHKINETLK